MWCRPNTLRRSSQNYSQLQSAREGEIMRTLICEGIGAFIIVEGWPFFLNVEVFSLQDSTRVIPNVMGKTFPCRVGLSLSAYLLELSLYYDSNFLWNSIGFQTCVTSILSHARPWALTYYRPMGQDPSGPMQRRFIMLFFTPLVAPFTLWSVMIQVVGPVG